ncbi:UDP-glucose 4-epimerase GalE [Zavarzinella formosa]|uniref:UDP-glucose 4-epimerase GalE n=1 Tax=Zavarzinella formosa TaxID=360055 RepID=UPI0002FE400A|nr:UDP-glucose 4-epimerase GalE [Zavarzinella formosa]
MRILVTGGAGYIGSHAMRALTAAGHEAWTYDNLSYGHPKAVKEDRLVIGDLLDKDRLDGTFVQNQIEAVLHFAAFAFVGESVTNPGIYYRNNVAGSLSLFEVMRRHDVRKIVFSSTCATYGIPDQIPITEQTPQRPINPYGHTKLMIEQALRDYSRAYGWGCVALRYFNASGAAADGSIGEDHTPETHLIPLLIAAALGRRGPVKIFGTDYPTPDGTCVRDYIHVDDLASAHLKALETLTPNSFTAINLGIGKGFSVREVIRAVEQVGGRPVPVEFSDRREGDPPALIADSRLAREKLGWEPEKTRLEDIVASAWNWHRQHPDGFRTSRQ